jgi:ornithine decarboxylase
MISVGHERRGDNEMKNRNNALQLVPLPEPPVDLNLSFTRAATLAEKVATPFLVLSATRIRKRIETLRTYLPGVELFYAMKSNPDPKMLGLLNGLVNGIDVASYGEVKAAAEAGISPDRIIHSNPIKKEIDIINCVKHGMQWFTFDNIDEIWKLQMHAPGTNVLLRVAIKNTSCVVNLGAKFGAQECDALPLLLAARDAGLQVRGIAFHVGSQSSDPGIYLTALRLVRGIFDQAAAVGLNLDTLDIGGGFPVSYRTIMPSIEEFCQVASQGLNEFFPEGVRVLAEPGRCISGDSITLVVRVIGRSVRNGIPWYYIDDGVYGAFSGKLFDNCDYQLIPLRSGHVTQCVVAGPTCDSIDIVAGDQMLPSLELGDLLVVPAMGAYTRASATCFNGFVPPLMVVDTEEDAFPTSQRAKCARPRRIGPRVSRIGSRQQIDTEAIANPETVS